MNRRKKSSVLDWFADFSIHSLLLHPFSLFIAATAVVLIGSSALWKQHRDQIAQEQFQLTAEKINLNEPPEWIRSDLRQAVFDGSRLEDWSLLDGEVVAKVRDAFAVDPWVEQVVRVEKSVHQISVTVKYRKPVAMVEFGGKHLLPVDRNGIILDGSDFESSQVNDYLRISVPDPVGGQIVTGQSWPDARVVAAAQIAYIWQEQWKQAGLFRIVNRSAPTLNASEIGKFELWSRKQSKLIWGNPPGNELEKEASADEKIAAILDHVRKNGGFDQKPGGHFDVRDGQVRPAKDTMRRVSHRQNEEE